MVVLCCGPEREYFMDFSGRAKLINRSFFKLLVGFVAVFGLIAMTMLCSSLIIAENIDKRVAVDEQIRVKASLENLGQKQAHQAFSHLDSVTSSVHSPNEIIPQLKQAGFDPEHIEILPKVASGVRQD